MATGQARGSVVGWAMVFASGGPQNYPFVSTTSLS